MSYEVSIYVPLTVSAYVSKSQYLLYLIIR